jgi:ectoine hydroxylase-related dioxygenase (phytanoyl-CoA dioxygenase family)
MLESLENDGYFLASRVLNAATIAELRAASETIAKRGATVRAASRNARRLLEACPEVAALAASATIRGLVEPVLGGGAFAVRGLLFDKVAGANWHVGWHQDLMIPVAERPVAEQLSTLGFTAWSVKEGVPHVRPPAKVLEQMLTLRIHLDDCPADNGPLEVLPGTHRLGIVPEEELRLVIENHQPHLVTAHAGDVLLMRPLLFHSSRPAASATHRRVVHLEFASEPLPGGLAWWRASPS